MPKLMIFYDVEGWAFHNRALALRKFAPPGYEVTLRSFLPSRGLTPDLGDTPPDIIFCLPASGAQVVRSMISARGWPTKLVVAWSTGWPNDLERFHHAYRAADLMIFNHRDYWEKLGKPPAARVIPNGVDETIYRATQPPEQRTPKVLWTGAAHAFDGKGYYDLVLPLGEALDACHIPFEFLSADSYGSNKRSPQEMAAWYNTGTILICASRAEGTPNPCLEAAACGCTVVSTPVGNMPDLIQCGVNGYLVERNTESLLRGVKAATENYPRLARQMLLDIRAWSYTERSREFYDAFDSLLAQSGSRSVSVGQAGKTSLHDAVTVFVTTVGAPSFEACLDHLAMQDTEFRLVTIRNKAPLSAAFQEMIDRCETPFYVQVDEDMLLYPDAVRTLHDRIASADADVAMCAANLFDVHLERCIIGVKIFRHGIVKSFPFRDVEGCESDQQRRLTASGYRSLVAKTNRTMTQEHAVGIHGACWTPEAIFERYATLQKKRRRDPVSRRWIDDYPAEFVRRFLRSRLHPSPFTGTEAPEAVKKRLHDRSLLDLYALFGLVAGALADLDELDGEKDHRRYGDLPGFDKLRSFIEEVSKSGSRRGNETGLR